ncbi:MAG TPA: hypothetical protein VFJ16_16980 [Longimicrobium sp.]|nr:hypothetical protein [Longimicrobium sp.]
MREKLEFFKKAAIWPLEFSFDPEGWLTNFRDDELDVAVALLDGFSYFAPELTKKILSTAFHRLSHYVADPSSAPAERINLWDGFRESVIITYPTDERPGATDSGRTYLRKARTILGLEQEQYMDPVDALSARILDPSRPLIFLDDFAGSGNQFCETWHRPYMIAGRRWSFNSAGGAGLLAYIPILSSHMAVRSIDRCASNVLFLPGHVVGEEYSAFHPESVLWPSPEVQQKARDVIYEASARAGIPLGDGSVPDDWCGYRELGLALAIDDTIPDACLTILYWNANGWQPLFRRP